MPRPLKQCPNYAQTIFLILQTFVGQICPNYASTMLQLCFDRLPICRVDCINAEFKRLENFLHVCYPFRWIYYFLLGLWNRTDQVGQFCFKSLFRSVCFTICTNSDDIRNFSICNSYCYSVAALLLCDYRVYVLLFLCTSNTSKMFQEFGVVSKNFCQKSVSMMWVTAMWGGGVS